MAGYVNPLDSIRQRASAAFSGRSYPLGHVPALDGLRGFLTLGVLAAHSKITLFSGIAINMDAFFVLSGYFITSLLLSEVQRTGSVDLVAFYRRRLRRLYPALCAMIFGVLAFSAIFQPRFAMGIMEAVVGLLYLKDYYHFLFDATGMVTTVHLWSLAVEEQFYILWPLLFIFLIRPGRASWQAVAYLAGLALSIAVLRAWLTYSGVSTGAYLYPAFHAHADSLLVGCALAFILKLADLHDRAALRQWLRRLLVPLFLAHLVTMFTMPHLASIYFYVASPLASLGTAVVIAGLVYAKPCLLHRLFENPVLTFCGRISYGLYVWHWPIFMFLVYEGSELMPLRITAAWILTLVLAGLSYPLLELRFLRPVHQKPRSGSEGVFATVPAIT